MPDKYISSLKSELVFAKSIISVTISFAFTHEIAFGCSGSLSAITAAIFSTSSSLAASINSSTNCPMKLYWSWISLSGKFSSTTTAANVKLHVTKHFWIVLGLTRYQDFSMNLIASRTVSFFARSYAWTEEFSIKSNKVNTSNFRERAFKLRMMPASSGYSIDVKLGGKKWSSTFVSFVALSTIWTGVLSQKSNILWPWCLKNSSISFQ